MTVTDGRILLNTGPSERGWHRIELASRCLRLYAFVHLLKLNSGDRTPLVRGSLLHVGCAHFYAQMRAVQQGTDPGRYYDPLDAMALVAPEWGELGKSLLPLTQQVMQQYMKYRAADAVNYQVVAVEHPVRAMLGGKYLFTQRWDLVLRDRAGLIWICDHKSSSKPGPSTILNYMLSGQFLGARVIAREMFKPEDGNPFGGVKINVLGCTPDAKGGFAFPRDNLPMADGAVDRFRDDIVALEDRLADLAARRVDPWEYPGAWHEHACQTRYGPCGYVDVCRFGKGSL